MKRSPDVLFVCVHNAGRSQMAKGFFNHLARERRADLIADSAGTVSSERLNPEVVSVMAETGIDLSAETPKLLVNEMLAGDPKVFTMGCAVNAETCPSLRMETVKDWGLPDPKGQPVDEVRSIRDTIKSLVAELLDELISEKDFASDGSQ